MTRLYVPEIGDKIVLTSDWIFPLYKEYRNDAVYSALITQADMNRFEWMQREMQEKRAKADDFLKRWSRRDSKIPMNFIFNDPSKERESGDLYEEYYAALRQWRDFSIIVTLPAGTEMTIDRIYVRKGQGDFSSLSFYITDSPNPALVSGKRKTKKRFWAKLADCNRIEFDLVESKVAA